MNKDEKAKRQLVRREGARKNSTSIRFSDNDKKIINQNAEDMNMLFSDYVRFAATHYGDALTIEKKAEIQNIINEAYEMVRSVDPDAAAELERKGDKLWEL